MNKLVFILFVSILAVGSAGAADTAAVNKVFKAVQRQYAPDKRSVYLNISYRNDTIVAESTSEAALSAFQDGLKSLNPLPLRIEKLPAANLKGMHYGVANLSVSNNRGTPAHSAELVTQLILGTPVEILKRQGSYFLVRSPDGYLSWTDGSAVAEMDKGDFEAWRAAEKVVFTADFGNVFSSPDAGSLRVSDLVAGNILRFAGTSGKFYKVELPDKRTGYISRDQSTLFSNWRGKPIPTAGTVLETAGRFIGAPYLWGGTSPKGMDCSGFTKTAFFLNGIIIPRDASQQALVGEPVDIMTADSLDVEKGLKNLLPGDLLFFSASKRRGVNGGRITHTAIYMGEGKFIQSAGMVKISSMHKNAPDYDDGQVPTIVGARRILTAVGQPEIIRVEEHPWYANN